MITDKQLLITDRRSYVRDAYNGLIPPKKGVTPLVNQLAKKFKVSTVTIYADLKALGLSGKEVTATRTA